MSASASDQGKELAGSMSWAELAQEHWGMTQLAELQGVVPDEAVACMACVRELRDEVVRLYGHVCGR